MPDLIIPRDPRPISDSLRRHFDEEAAAIPAGKRGQANLGLTTEGIGAGLSTRLGARATVSGWAGKLWKGEGWSAGARVSTSW